MNKQEFLKNLRVSLSNLPQEEIEERIIFYSEMIDDRIEEGLSEEEAVSGIGVIDDTPTQTTNEQPKTKRKLKAWEIVLLILGSPIWFSLLIAALAVAIAVYGSVIVSLWAAFGAVASSALGCVVAGVIFTCIGKALTGVASIGVGIALAGLSIFCFFGCLATTKGSIFLTKKIFQLIKRRLRND